MNTRIVSGAGACLLAGVGFVAACASTAQAAIFTRVAVLTPSQEVPPNASTAYGCGRFVIDTDANTVSYRIVYQNLTTPELFAHIHGFSAPGVNSGILHTLPNGQVKVGTWMYTEAQEADILNGRCYVNVHSNMFGGGEIRGQIVAAVALLDGGQENPPNASTASGFGLFNLDTTTNTLQYYILTTPMASGELFAHIHGYALPGSNAGIVHTLPNGTLKTGSWIYPEVEEQRIIDGMTYVNVHSNMFGGGEIRGQVVTSVNPVDPGQEVPPTPTQGAGCGLISFNRAAGILGYDIRYSNLSSAELFAHIHGYSAPGVNSPVRHTLPTTNPKRGTWTIPVADVPNVLSELTYINIHSSNFGGGEMRGQIYFAQLIPPPVGCTVTCDYNIDGGNDTGDVIDLADAIASGSDPFPTSCKDFNQDGGADTGDVIDMSNAVASGTCP